MIDEAAAEVCKQRGHVIKSHHVHVAPRTRGQCAFCAEWFDWVEPRAGYWADGNNKFVFTTQGPTDPFR